MWILVGTVNCNQNQCKLTYIKKYFAEFKKGLRDYGLHLEPQVWLCSV